MLNKRSVNKFAKSSCALRNRRLYKWQFGLNFLPDFHLICHFIALLFTDCPFCQQQSCHQGFPLSFIICFQPPVILQMFPFRNSRQRGSIAYGILVFRQPEFGGASQPVGAESRDRRNLSQTFNLYHSFSLSCILVAPPTFSPPRLLTHSLPFLLHDPTAFARQKATRKEEGRGGTKRGHENDFNMATTNCSSTFRTFIVMDRRRI